MKDEILVQIEKAAEDFSAMVESIEDGLDRLVLKVKNAGLADHKRAPVIADKLILTYPELPGQVREFLECVRDGRTYENHVSNLSMVI